MLHMAEQLAAPFGFVRVGLYNLREQILFSELTSRPWLVAWSFLRAVGMSGLAPCG